MNIHKLFFPFQLLCCVLLAKFGITLGGNSKFNSFGIAAHTRFISNYILFSSATAASGSI